MNKELLPCPFCGGKAYMKSRYMSGIANKKHYIIECRDCKATFNRPDWFRTMKRVSELWNTRYAPNKSYDELLEKEWELK